MELVLKIFISGFLLCYLVIQSTSDVKTMKVSALFNDAAVFISGIVFLLRFFLAKDAHLDVTVIVVCGAIIALGLMNVYGSGDLKAYLAMYLGMAPYCTPGTLNLDAFLVGVLAGCATAFFWQVVVKGKKVIHNKTRFPYFPFLAVTHVVTTILLIWTNLGKGVS